MIYEFKVRENEFKGFVRYYANFDYPQLEYEATPPGAFKEENIFKFNNNPAEHYASLYGSLTDLPYFQFHWVNDKIVYKAYTLSSHYDNRYVLRSWNISVSNDGMNWTTIDFRTKEESLYNSNAVTFYMKEPQSIGYSYIKITMTEPDNAGYFNLRIMNIDFYGYIENFNLSTIRVHQNFFFIRIITTLCYLFLLP